MSNWAILKASTIHGAKAAGKEAILGSIGEGKLADLLLLNSNPITDLGAIKEIELIIKDGRAIQPDTLIKLSPEDLVQQQLNAYNAKNIEAFVRPFADDVKVYKFPNEEILHGKEALRESYQSFFSTTSDLHCELVNRLVQGNTIIDQEKVTGIPNVDVLHATAIYKIKDQLISEVYFIK